MGPNYKLQVINWATFFLYVTKEEKLISKVAQSCVYFNALYVDSSDWGLKRKNFASDPLLSTEEQRNKAVHCRQKQNIKWV